MEPMNLTGLTIESRDHFHSNLCESCIIVRWYDIQIGILHLSKFDNKYSMTISTGRQIGRTNNVLLGAWHLLAYATFPV